MRQQHHFARISDESTRWADPRARVELAGESFDVTARELPPDERQDIIPKVNALGSAFAEFQANTSRVIPIFELNEV